MVYFRIIFPSHKLENYPISWLLLMIDPRAINLFPVFPIKRQWEMTELLADDKLCGGAACSWNVGIAFRIGTPAITWEGA
jgi:hypothetical protein